MLYSRIQRMLWPSFKETLKVVKAELYVHNTLFNLALESQVNVVIREKLLGKKNT